MPAYPITSDSGLRGLPPQYLGDGDSGLILRRDDSTNSAEVFRLPAEGPSDWAAEATFSYAIAHYGDLLKKLAD